MLSVGPSFLFGCPVGIAECAERLNLFLDGYDSFLSRVLFRSTMYSAKNDNVDLRGRYDK